MEDTALGQVTRNAAEVYEKFFVPALFEQWAERICDAGGIKQGDRVLDVACGTGVVARKALPRAMPGGWVTGLDRNELMLEVARRLAPDVEWRPGMAETLPYADGSFDVVLSQFGLMFFEDRARALREMRRVLKPGGRVAVAVWAPLDTSPGYAAMASLLDRLFGAKVAAALKAPFSLGDRGNLGLLLSEAGLNGCTVRTVEGIARFPSLESWVHTDVKGWTIADLIDDVQYERLLAAAREELAQFTQGDGSVSFAAPAHIVSTSKD